MVSAAWGAKDGELKDLMSLPDIGDVPDLCSLKALGAGMGYQGDQGFSRRPDLLTGIQVGKPAHNPSEDLPEVISCCLGLIGSL